MVALHESLVISLCLVMGHFTLTFAIFIENKISEDRPMKYPPSKRPETKVNECHLVPSPFKMKPLNNYIIYTWAPCCCALQVMFNPFFSYHVSIWFLISHYYLYQFQI
jgi:hypothetical protein